MNEEGLTVGQLAESSGVTVRTLHHYDRIGLLEPSGRTTGGHRRYAAEDVHALYRIVALRQLGLSLSHIAGVLRDQQPIAELLQRQLDETTRSIQAHQELLTRLKRGVAAAHVRAEDLFDVIAGTFELSFHEVEGPLRPVDASAASIITMMFEGLDGSHAAMRRQLKVLTDATLATAGHALFRAITFEDRYVMSVLQNKPTVFDDQGWAERLRLSEIEWGAVLPAGVGVADVVEYAEAVFTATVAYVASIDEAELCRDIPGPGESALTWSMKVAELLAQVVSVGYQSAGRTAASTGTG